MTNTPTAERLLFRLSPVHAFSPDAIPEVSTREAIVALAPHVDTVSIGHDQTAWSLRDDVRIAALARHPDATSALEAARSVEQRVPTPTQRLLERWLEKGPVSAAEEGLDLVAFERVTRWLSDVPWSREAAQRARAESALVTRRRSLEGIAHKLVGRDAELRRLEAAALGRTNERVLVLDALGGMGKSALIAGVELRLDAWRQDAPVVIVHLDLDHVDIDYRSPISLLAAMVRQLSERLPETFEAFLGEVNALETRTADAELEAAQVGRQVRGELDSREAFLRSNIEGLLSEAFSQKRLERLLVVVDTLERPQREAPGLAVRVLETLWRTIGHFPSTMVVAGRAIEVPRSLLAVRVPLAQLSEEQAFELLTDRAVSDELAHELAGRLPGRPLTLRLAARAVVTEKVLDVKDPQLQRAIDRALVDGFLQLRMLDHVEPRLQGLIRPGFALRRLTPRLVHEVLGTYTTPAVKDVRDARELLEQLRLVSELVLETQHAEELVIRPEVRSELLSLIKVDGRAILRGVHGNAAQWFEEALQEQEDVGARAELVYHLLARGDVESAEQAWHEGVVPGLADALPDLDEPARSWLVQRLPAGVGQESSGSSAASSREDAPIPLQVWERQLVSGLETLIGARRLSDAVKLLEQRRERSEDSPLFLLSARLYRLLDDAPRAVANANRALLNANPPPQEGELLRIIAWAACRQNRVDALASVEQAWHRVHDLTDPVDQLRALVDLVSILAPRRDSESRRLLGTIDDEIGLVFTRVSEGALAADRDLLTRAAAQLHDATQQRRAIAIGVLNQLRDPNLVGLFLILNTLSDTARESVASICHVEWHYPDPYPDDKVNSALSVSPTLVAKVAEQLLFSSDSPRVVETIRQLIARDAAGDAEGIDSKIRLAALGELERFLAERQQRFESWWSSTTVAGVDGKPGLSALIGQARDVPRPALFVAAVDRVGIFNAVLTALAHAWPENVRELGSLRARLVRPAPFRHFPVEQVAAFHAVVVDNHAIEPATLRDLWKGNAFGAIAPWGDDRNQLSVALYDLLMLTNETERIAGHVPMELLLLNAIRLPLSEEAMRLAKSMLGEFTFKTATPAHESIGSKVSDRSVVSSSQQMRPFDEREHRDAEGRGSNSLNAVNLAVAELHVPLVVGGRVTTDASGDPALTRASAWLVASNLLMTAFHVLKPPDEQIDQADLERRAKLASAIFYKRDGAHVRSKAAGVAAWSEKLDYAILRLEQDSGKALAIAGTPAVGAHVLMLQVDAQGRRVFGIGQVLALDDTRLTHDVVAEAGASGAPLTDLEGRVVAVELGYTLDKDERHVGIAVPASAILADLQARFPDVATRISVHEAAASVTTSSAS